MKPVVLKSTIESTSVRTEEEEEGQFNSSFSHSLSTLIDADG